MEILLNLIWFVLAISAFLFWRTNEEEGTLHRREHGAGCRLAVLACALVLLFPIISLTDDLHAEQAPMEDSSRSVMKARGLAHHCARAGQTIVPALVPPAIYTIAAQYNAMGSVTTVASAFAKFVFRANRSGRSPPFSA